MTRLDFLNAPVEWAARRLLGCELVSDIGPRVRVRIVEVEAYDEHDEASHTFRGQNARNAAMFLGAGHLYVYRSMGIHYCCNVVTGAEGHGAGVLIRAAEPLEGIEEITRRRGREGIGATNGPGKLGQALGADVALSGSSLEDGPITLVVRDPAPDEEIATGVRVGISKAAELPRRFYLRGNPYVSRHHGAPGPRRAATEAGHAGG
ncbi:putative 3-methyladenine DNA glycosylase [Microbacterium nanhaiense]|uniref:Putative 3-methyladenine DNA glycosylase n=1 Tax=Microbacterium nanhaiense TaxID=1301026 RepID=A0ABQ2MZG7_9MICO|nr:DNA-3-methyladenine glycosylase [Microbacterium nanhaiense]GGO61400.1 putative 3-methyladenine DNA glycosylase [Microbacterium nanhaiense]